MGHTRMTTHHKCYLPSFLARLLKRRTALLPITFLLLDDHSASIFIEQKEVSFLYVQRIHQILWDRHSLVRRQLDCTEKYHFSTSIGDMYQGR